jgi:hypothetical protein
MNMLKCDVAIIGGGLGGVAAALALTDAGRTVVMTEETVWLGGQVTSQGVPPDEHRRIEETGCTASYRRYRTMVRQYYRSHYPLREAYRDKPDLNPGGGSVSRLCHEPKVSARVLEDLLSAVVSSGQLQILRQARVISAESDQDQIRSVVVETPEGLLLVAARMFLDATECGDLLPLTGTEYVTGSEAKSDTGEWHAPEQADPQDMQAITWCFAVSREASGDYTIDKPDRYDYYMQHISSFWPGSQLSWTYSQPITLEPVDGAIDPLPGQSDLFTYRKILGHDAFEPGFLRHSGEITLVNWPQNDYWLGSVIDVPESERQHHWDESRELSRCFLYWLQTEAPRPDGGNGYPNLKPRGDALGTQDGFAMYPYIREARRIVPLVRILESHVGKAMREDLYKQGKIAAVTAEQFADSVGIGYYRIDLHPSTGQRNYIDIESLPFQIPLGSLIPVRTANLLAACKNIGTTHITNGCYRLHPVEWNIGEAAGACAAFCLEHDLAPQKLHQDPAAVALYQEILIQRGIPLSWPEQWQTGL